ncbi:MAG: thermonuclease family protein [Hyphomonadaceae bacterium]
MARRGKVVAFRKRPARKHGYSSVGFRRLKRFIAPVLIVGLLLAAGAIALLDGRPGENTATGSANSDQNVRVSWVDGDSGRVDGQEFRLHGVDAPEGSPDRALCARERVLSGDARNAARSVTEGKTVRVSRRYGADSYGRELVDLSANGKDVANQLVAAGHLKRWNFEGGESKPDWCG